MSTQPIAARQATAVGGYIAFAKSQSTSSASSAARDPPSSIPNATRREKDGRNNKKRCLREEEGPSLAYNGRTQRNARCWTTCRNDGLRNKGRAHPTGPLEGNHPSRCFPESPLGVSPPRHGGSRLSRHRTSASSPSRLTVRPATFGTTYL